MRATPGLIGAGIATGLMYLLRQQRGKHRRRAISRVNAPRRVTHLAQMARREHPWAVFGTAASVLTAGAWRLWRRPPGKMRTSTPMGAPIEARVEAAAPQDT